MINNNEIPYGALYSFQPDYMVNIIHDEIHHDAADESELPAANTWACLGHRVLSLFK